MEPMVLYIIATVCSAIIAGGGIFAFWISLASRMTTNKITAENAERKADDAQKRIDALIELLSNQRETSAKDFGRLEAFNDGVIKAMETNDRRLTVAVSEMTGSIHHLTERFDRFIERIPIALTVSPSPPSAS